MARDRTPNTGQSIRFASALTFETDAKMAALELGARIKRALEGNRVDLALVFATSHYAEEAHALLERVRDALSPRVLVGCSGEGVIGPEREVEGEQAVAVVAAHLPDVELRSFNLVPAEILQAAESPLELEKVVHVPKETRAFILLGDPFSAQIDGLLRAFNTVHPGVPVIGGYQYVCIQLEQTIYDFPNTFIYNLDSLSRGLKIARMPYHVTVGEVDKNESEGILLEFAEQCIGNYVSFHFRMAGKGRRIETPLYL